MQVEQSKAHCRGRVRRPARLVTGMLLRTPSLALHGGKNHDLKVKVPVIVRMMMRGYTPEIVKRVKNQIPCVGRGFKWEISVPSCQFC